MSQRKLKDIGIIPGGVKCPWNESCVLYPKGCVRECIIKEEFSCPVARSFSIMDDSHKENKVGMYARKD